MSDEKPILYGFYTSPPVRSVLLTLRALNMDFEFKKMNPFKGDLKTPEYLKKNPQHSVPMWEEPDGKCIWDSHAIMAYLVRKYGSNDSLYPKDFYLRAVVDQRLHCDNGSLFMGVLKHKLAPFRLGTAKKEDWPAAQQSAHEAYELLEKFLGTNRYMACDQLTLADFSIVTSVTGIDFYVPIDKAQYPVLAAWLGRMKSLPYYEEVNAEGLKKYSEVVATGLATTLN